MLEDDFFPSSKVDNRTFADVLKLNKLQVIKDAAGSSFSTRGRKVFRSESKGSKNLLISTHAGVMAPKKNVGDTQLSFSRQQQSLQSKKVASDTRFNSIKHLVGKGPFGEYKNRSFGFKKTLRVEIRSDGRRLVSWALVRRPKLFDGPGIKNGLHSASRSKDVYRRPSWLIGPTPSVNGPQINTGGHSPVTLTTQTREDLRDTRKASLDDDGGVVSRAGSARVNPLPPSSPNLSKVRTERYVEVEELVESARVGLLPPSGPKPGKVRI